MNLQRVHSGCICRAIAVVVVAALGVSTVSQAVEDPRETADPGNFVKEAVLDGMLEVELGQAAQKNTQDPQVQAFAAQMIADHGAANKDLLALAQRKNFPRPLELDGEHREVFKALAAKRGVQFDRAYAAQTAGAHATTISLFTQASQGSDPEVAALAKRLLPVLRGHKEMAESLRDKVGGPVEKQSTDRRE